MSIKEKQGRNQGDRKGRPYPVTKHRMAETVYGRGDPCGRPGSHDRYVSGGRPGFHEHHASYRRSEIIEQDLAQRWHTLPLMQSLPLVNGDACQLCYAGRPGGPPGPDIRDAILQFASEHTGTAGRAVGDVEFHVRCSDWYAHGHHTDPRYNNVILYVVLLFDSAGPVLRHDGHAVPVCSLNDLVPTVFPQPLWACQCIMPSMDTETRAALLQRAGLLRFEQKTQHLLSQLQLSRPHAPFSAYDVCLIPALVEALGYGRDRAFFCAVGQRLVGLSGNIPEPAGRAAEPSSLDAGRLRTSGQRVEQWRVKGAWETIKDGLKMEENQSFSCVKPGQVYTPALASRTKTIDSLRALFPGIGPARADILNCNVVLPFAAAVGHFEQDEGLHKRARELFEAYPKLSSNQVTRSMYRQLGLEREPRSACQQQGLHYIYAQTCREKQCAACFVVGREM